MHCVIIFSLALPFRTSLHLLPKLLHESYFEPTMLVSGKHHNAHSVVEFAVRIRIRKTDRERLSLEYLYTDEEARLSPES